VFYSKVSYSIVNMLLNYVTIGLIVGGSIMYRIVYESITWSVIIDDEMWLWAVVIGIGFLSSFVVMYWLFGMNVIFGIIRICCLILSVGLVMVLVGVHLKGLEATQSVLYQNSWLTIEKFRWSFSELQSCAERVFGECGFENVSPTDKLQLIMASNNPEQLTQLIVEFKKKTSAVIINDNETYNLYEVVGTCVVVVSGMVCITVVICALLYSVSGGPKVDITQLVTRPELDQVLYYQRGQSYTLWQYGMEIISRELGYEHREGYLRAFKEFLAGLVVERPVGVPLNLEQGQQLGGAGGGISRLLSINSVGVNHGWCSGCWVKTAVDWLSVFDCLM